MDDPKDIYAVLADAKGQIGFISKGEKNTNLGYAFRGIDSILNKVGPILTELGIVVYPKHRLLSSEEVTSKSGGRGYRVVVESEWMFAIGSDGSRPYSAVTATTLGEAIDYSDKAINKAQTQSFKNALAQVLSIPTGEPDPDEETPEQVVPETTAAQALREIAEAGVEPAGTYATQAMDRLAIEHPIPEERVEELVDMAVELWKGATAQFDGLEDE